MNDLKIFRLKKLNGKERRSWQSMPTIDGGIDCRVLGRHPVKRKKTEPQKKVGLCSTGPTSQ